MGKKRLPKSVRKHIRLQKARLRRQFSGAKKEEELMRELYRKDSRKDSVKNKKLRPAKKPARAADKSSAIAPKSPAGGGKNDK